MGEDHSGFTSLGDIDFSNYEAIAMVCHNDTISNIPTSGMVDGQWFYANDIKVLYLYEQKWVPIISFGALTLYVDVGSGSDASGKGFSSGSGATATIQYAVDLIPAICGGNVIVNIALSCSISITLN